MSELSWLTDAPIGRPRPFFPKSRGKPRADDRRVLSGIIFVQRKGLLWSEAPNAVGSGERAERPAAYGPPKTLYKRWKRWGRMVSQCPDRKRHCAMHPLPHRPERSDPARRQPLSPAPPDRKHARTSQGLASDRNPLRSPPHPVSLGLRPRRDRHLLVVRPGRSALSLARSKRAWASWIAPIFAIAHSASAQTGLRSERPSSVNS